MVGTDGELPLPWIAPLLGKVLNAERSHAWLLHGPQGVGQFELALTLAQAWLCESPQTTARPCGRCASCRLFQAHSHPDLLLLIPQALQESLGWSASDAPGGTAAGAGKVKPSKDIKVDAVREAVGFAQITSARGRGKVVVVHPAERMNTIAANTLLKTLEEPPGTARFVLSCGDPQALLPTVRSRCQSAALALPTAEQSAQWLAAQGVAEAPKLLAAAGGQPLLALDWARQGLDAATWARLPRSVAHGVAAGLIAWPLPRVIDAMQKLCHDAACVACGGVPRYFEAHTLPAPADLKGLSAWMRQLNRIAAHAEHPWNAALLVESLVLQGQRALAARVG